MNSATLVTSTTNVTRCPVCGDDVFIYRNDNGSVVFFNSLGPPWPKHECMHGEAAAAASPLTVPSAVGRPAAARDLTAESVQSSVYVGLAVACSLTKTRGVQTRGARHDVFACELRLIGPTPSTYVIAHTTCALRDALRGPGVFIVDIARESARGALPPRAIVVGCTVIAEGEPGSTARARLYGMIPELDELAGADVLTVVHRSLKRSEAWGIAEALGVLNGSFAKYPSPDRVRSYDVRASFDLGEFFGHRVHGVGVVVERSDADSMVVRFADGAYRTLAQNRKGNDA